MTEKFLDFARGRFDEAGITRLSGKDRLLILGLESTPERDLDEFARIQGRFRMPGFEEHVTPRLESIADFARDLGFNARLVGRLGYPDQRQLYLKGEILRAGLGKRGKNTVILHPRFGPWLRFGAVLTDAPLVPAGSPAVVETENPMCRGCSICIDACPQQILEPYLMTDPAVCRSDSDNMAKRGDHLVACDLCIKSCPAGVAQDARR